MADLKESSGLEQDGDYIFLLYRPFVRDKSIGGDGKFNHKPSETFLILEKNKFGRTGMFELEFDLCDLQMACEYRFTVQRCEMRTDTSCTIYRKIDGAIVRYSVSACHWQEQKAANVLKSGRNDSDSLTVYIPLSAVVQAPDGAVVPLQDLFPQVDVNHKFTAEDMIVKGDCPFEFDGDTEQSVSNSMREFRENHEVRTIMSVDRLFYGPIRLQHIKISAR